MTSKHVIVTNEEKISQLLLEFRLIRIAFSLPDAPPYIVPLDFGYLHEGEQLIFYFHSKERGRKFDLLLQEPLAGFELDGPHRQLAGKQDPLGFQSYYASIIGEGRIRHLTDLEDKRQALSQIIQHTSGNQPFRLKNKQVEESDIFALYVTELNCRLRQR